MEHNLYLGDCLEIMPSIPDNSVQLILCDLPYGTTKNKWDNVIPYDKLWVEYNRILKPGGVVALYGMGLFSAKTILSNEKNYKYSWVWEKTAASGFFNAKKMPMSAHENINIFYNSKPIYNPQKTTGHARKVSTAAHKRNSKKSTNYGDHVLASYDSTERYPRSVLKFASDKQKHAYHSTQKPVALNKYMVQTYTNEGDLVLDNCSGSGSTGIACGLTNRSFIGIEKEEETFLNSIDHYRNYFPGYIPWFKTFVN